MHLFDLGCCFEAFFVMEALPLWILVVVCYPLPDTSPEGMPQLNLLLTLLRELLWAAIFQVVAYMADRKKRMGVQ